MSGASRVSRSSRLTKLRVTLSASASSPADRSLLSSNSPFHRCARANARMSSIVGPCISAVRRYDYPATTAAFPGHRDADGDRRAVELPSRRHKRVEMYGKSRVFAADFQRWMHVSMIPLPKGSLAGNHGRQLQLPVFRARLAAIFNGEPGWRDAGSD
jgi:hypothetical protein